MNFSFDRQRAPQSLAGAILLIYGLSSLSGCGGGKSTSTGSSLLSSTVVPVVLPPASAPLPAPPLLPLQLAIHPELVLPYDSFFQPQVDPASTKEVFAHYMVCCAAFGGPNQGVNGAMQDILMAQSMGLTGFALNEGAWSGDINYRNTTANLFAAAAQLGTGFKLFFSYDGLGPSEVIDMMTTYGTHPNYFKVAGRPVLSTFAAGGNIGLGYTSPLDWWSKGILEPLKAKGIDTYFVPDFADAYWNQPPAKVLDYWGDRVQGMMDWGVLGVLNGFGGNQYAVNENEAYAPALKSANKTFMAAVINQYWGSLQTSVGRHYFEFEAGKGLDIQWKELINSAHPDWVEILTWNDLEESYMMPIDDFMKYNDWGFPHNYWKPHKGYSELERYYIQWYKTGIEPKITKDSIIYFYRTQPVNFTATADPRGPVNWWTPSVSDTIYLTVPLTSPATLTVTSGGTIAKFDLPAGMNQVATPFIVGVQQFELSRGGKQISSVQGEPIVSTAEWYDYWMTTGFVETAPLP